MLELKRYTVNEMAAATHSPTDKQSITRKLDRCGISYTCEGWGKTLNFTITDIPDRFKVYCILDLGISSNADFKKLRNLFYYLFCVEGFAEMSYTQMAEWLSETDTPVSRQTISKWLAYLKDINYIYFTKSNCIYYKINKRNGKKIYTEIDRKTYNTGWQIYFQTKEETNNTDTAYERMFHYIGGHPYKVPIIVENAICQKEIEQLIEYVNESFDKFGD